MCIVSYSFASHRLYTWIEESLYSLIYCSILLKYCGLFKWKSILLFGSLKILVWSLKVLAPTVLGIALRSLWCFLQRNWFNPLALALVLQMLVQASGCGSQVFLLGSLHQLVLDCFICWKGTLAIPWRKDSWHSSHSSSRNPLLLRCSFKCWADDFW